jgi:hypothetical protein
LIFLQNNNKKKKKKRQQKKKKKKKKRQWLIGSPQKTQNRNNNDIKITHGACSRTLTFPSGLYESPIRILAEMVFNGTNSSGAPVKPARI